MICNSFTLNGLNNACREINWGGIKEIAIAYFDSVSTTINESTNTIVPTLLEGKVYTYQLKKNSGSLTSTFEAESGLYQNEVTFTIDKLDSGKRAEFMGLIDSPLVLLVRDNNNHIWLIGNEDSVLSSGGSVQTGQNITDKGTYSITFSNYSKELPYEVLETDYNEFNKDYSKEYLTFEYIEGIDEIEILLEKNTSEQVQIEYSYDKNDWNIIDGSHSAIISCEGFNKKVYFRGINQYITYDEEAINDNVNYFRFEGEGKIAIYGNLLSIVYEDFEDKDYAPQDCTFASLFGGGLLSETNNVVKYAHNLILPSYFHRFAFYSLFDGCESLITTPELPATELQEGCYQNMFYDCISLRTAPELPATELAEGCYESMFGGCTDLNYVKCLAEENIEGNCNSWLSDVAQTGTFVKNPNATWGQGASGVPAGWTIINA